MLPWLLLIAVHVGQAEVSRAALKVVEEKPLLPPGPLRSLSELTRQELVHSPQPLLLHSEPLVRSFGGSGFGDWQGLVERFGDEDLLFSADTDASAFLPKRHVKIRRYVQRLLDKHRRASPLPETGGRHFFLARPDLYRTIASAYSRLLPRGFREMLDVDSSEAQHELSAAARAGDFSLSDLTMGIADAGHETPARVEFVTGVLLTHLQGRRRVVLYPASQLKHLGLDQVVENDGWGARSPSGSWPREADAAELTPLEVELRAGETLLIPCGWAYREVLLEPSLAITCAVHPDWLDNLLKTNETWAPGGCAVWMREPCGQEGCEWLEL